MNEVTRSRVVKRGDPARPRVAGHGRDGRWKGDGRAWPGREMEAARRSHLDVGDDVSKVETHGHDAGDRAQDHLGRYGSIG